MILALIKGKADDDEGCDDMKKDKEREGEMEGKRGKADDEERNDDRQEA